MLCTLLVSQALAVLLSQAAAAPQPATPAKTVMTSYQLVLLRSTPKFAAAVKTPEGQELLKNHVGYLYKTAASGSYMVAGPVLDDSGIAGLIVVKAESPAAALALEAQDPAVQAGLFTTEASTFMAPEGWFGKWAEFGAFEKVFFGFLVSGPDRTQSAETAKRLQGEHLAYMEGQAAEGKLVMAGPFTAEGARRGVVVYRVADAAEAQRRAEGDPMVRAGRLAVQLHPWQVPQGALPAVMASGRSAQALATATDAGRNTSSPMR